MITIPGYTITETIHESVKTIVYRGYRDENEQPVILKITKAEFPTLEETTRFKQEYKILENLNLTGIIKAYALEAYQNQTALILEDLGGESLKNFMQVKKISLSDSLKIGIKITSALSNLHHNNIIHKDIKPKNIIINPQTGEVKITDFGIASRLPKENPFLSNPNSLEGTIAYISPEQTGRMNRVIDYRTDLYSLGVTFYELLTGQLPFQATDPLELIHCHIAVTPISPHQLQPEIPPIISEIVMKLLAKTAEERYQSAYGLQADLEQCLKQLETTGEISRFPLGQQDISGQMLIPQKLYGREAEVAKLMTAFARVSISASEMMLVSGYSGIGKSSLVNEIQKPILQQRGYFIAGKFDQFKRNIPYISVIQAFQELLRQVLTESSEKLQEWKTQLLSQLGNNGQVIIDVIPEVELIIGKQPKVPQLGPSESQNRFNRVFQEFIRVFAKKEHPLVIFLDDLQWADSPSLKLIQTLITDQNSKYMLLLGAYRDNEVSVGHPLMQTLENIQQTKAVVNNIVLSHLQISDVNQLVADTFTNNVSTYTERTKPLAELIFQKTQGNPFFLTQLLKSLYQENLISFDFTPLNQQENQGGWKWDIEQIKEVGVTDNVVDLMTNKIKKLPATTQNSLKLAACIGNSFDLEILSIIHEKSFLDTASDIWSALQEGLILPLSNAYKVPLVIGEETAAALRFDAKVGYKFLHDRVQQAAYTLIPESEKKTTHLKIGQLLLESQSPEEQNENIFELVNQLNYGVDLISTQVEKDRLAYLDLIAGKKAIASTAYEPAAKYLNVGISLLAADSWQSQYDLTLDIYDATIEAEYLNTNYQQSKALIDIALEQTRTLLDKVRIYKRQIQFYVAQGDLQASVDTALEVIAMLGVPLPTESEAINAYCQQLRSELVFEKSQISELVNLPEISDPNKQAVMEVLNTMPGPVYIVRPQVFLPMMLTMTSLSVKYGNCPTSAFAYCIYGMLLGAVFRDIDSGYEWGQLSLKVLDRFNEKALRCNVMKVYSTHIQPCKEHFRVAIESLQLANESALETGNPEFLGYGSGEYVIYLFFSGENLETVNQKAVPCVELIESFKQDLGIYYIRIARQVVLTLLGNATNKFSLTGDSFNEETMLPLVIAADWKMLLCCFYLFKLILAYLFKNYAAALAHAKLTEANLEGVLGMIMAYEFNFYHSLVLLALSPTLPDSEREQYLSQVEVHQETMRYKAFYAPMNYQHKYDLVEAEKARVLGQNLEAMEYYDRAIQGARKQGYLQEAALANELAAEFYLILGREKIAKVYMTDAYNGYVAWGAQAKIKDLDSRYSHLIVRRTNKSSSLNSGGVRSLTSTSGGISKLLDLATVLKASQAIAGEIFLDKLLEKLMKIVLENAGAQQGFLISENSGQLVIEATASIGKSNNFVEKEPQNHQANHEHLPLSIINYVQRTQENVVLNDVTQEGIFTVDPYIKTNKPKSVLCTPILHQGKLINILYLENNLTTGAFTPDRIEVLKLLSAQIAISLENAQLYSYLSQANAQLQDYSRTLEDKVTERTKQLENANQDLRDFAHVVSHDLKAPLRSIGMLAQWIAADYADKLDDDGQEQLDLLSEQVKRSQELIIGILRYSEMGSREGEKVAMNLTQIVREVIQSLTPPTHIKVKVARELPTLLCDPIQMRQVFQNLISNAIKYMDKAQGEVTIDYTNNGEHYQFCVADNGMGIESKYFDHIFQLFRTIASQVQIDSTGVGLSTVKKIVELNGGKIWVESELGQGSTFFFTLPK